MIIDELVKAVILLEQYSDLHARINKVPNCKLKTELKKSIADTLECEEMTVENSQSTSFQAFRSRAIDAYVIKFGNITVLVRAGKGDVLEYSTDNGQSWKPGTTPSSSLPRKGAV